MRRTEVDIFYNNEKGYIFASKTNYIGLVTNGTVKPVLLLLQKNITEEIIGQQVRKALDISRNAEPIDKNLDGVYEFWKDVGMKRFSTFSGNYKFLEIEELDERLFYRRYLHVNRGGYVAECKAEDRRFIDINVSDKELGTLVKKEIQLPTSDLRPPISNLK